MSKQLNSQCLELSDPWAYPAMALQEEQTARRLVCRLRAWLQELQRQLLVLRLQDLVRHLVQQESRCILERNPNSTCGGKLSQCRACKGISSNMRISMDVLTNNLLNP